MYTQDTCSLIYSLFPWFLGTTATYSLASSVFSSFAVLFGMTICNFIFGNNWCGSRSGRSSGNNPRYRLCYSFKVAARLDSPSSHESDQPVFLLVIRPASFAHGQAHKKSIVLSAVTSIITLFQYANVVESSSYTVYMAWLSRMRTVRPTLHKARHKAAQPEI
jgi:hypothetical protein